MAGAFGKKLIDNGFTIFSCIAGRSARTKSIAISSGFCLKDSFEDVIDTSDVLFSLVPPESALSIAEAFRKSVHNTGRKPVYVDCNSVSPATTQRIASIVERSGTPFIDGVFIGSANLLNTKTTLYLSGRGGEELKNVLTDAVRVVYLGENIGEASALKMCFAGFNKGLIALFLEIACASGKTGNWLELIQCLEEFYPGTIKTVRRLLPSYPKHANRRVHEIGELVIFLNQLGQKHFVADGARSVLKDLSEMFARNCNDSRTRVDESLDFEGIIEFCISNNMLSSTPKKKINQEIE